MKESRKKKLLALAALLALIAVISGTFAWLTSQEQKINRVQSAAVVDDSVTVNEKWEPKPIVPGTEATKEVSVTNTGTGNVFLRVSYEEVLKYLTSKGEVTYSGSTEVEGAKFDPAAEATLTSHVPVIYNKEKINAASGFIQVPDDQVTGLEEGTHLFVKGGKNTEATSEEVTSGYEAVVVHEYATGEYQGMRYEVKTLDNSASDDAKDWTFGVSGLKYGYYANGYSNSVANWAHSSLAPKGQTDVTGSALLETEGQQDEKTKYDYTPAGLGIASIPGANSPKIPADSGLIPLANSEEKGVQADKAVVADKNLIKIGYGDAITTVAALPSETAAELGKWVYNQDDGWFYYTQPLKPSQTTPQLLKKLIFDGNIGKELNNATYDLIVKMEAIQATEEALTDDAGWKLDIEKAENIDTKAIVAHLVGKI